MNNQKSKNYQHPSLLLSSILLIYVFSFEKNLKEFKNLTFNKKYNKLKNKIKNLKNF